MTEITRRAPFGDSPRVGRRGANTRRKILDAALAAFDEHGFHDTRIELIASAAGCSRPSFYQYFSSKDEVFWTLAGELAKELSKLSDSLVAVDADQSGVEQLRVWLDKMIELYAMYAAVFASFPSAAGEPSTSTHGPQIVAKRLGHAINAAIDLPDDTVPNAVGSITLTVIIRSIDFWRAGLGQLSQQHFVEGLAQTLHRLMHGPKPDINMEPVVARPAIPEPKWPTLAVDRQHVSRPRGRATRQKLLTVGAEVLHSNGYHETHVDDIVTRAGVSHGSFYHYFSSKDALFQELAENATTSVAEVIKLFPDEIDQPHLQQWLDIYFASYRNNGGVISVWREIKWGNAELNRYSLDVALATLDRLQRIVDRRNFGDSSVDALALLALIERVPYNTQTLQYSGQTAAIDAAAFLLQRALFGQELEQS